jgi:hypothetical protein
MVAGYSVLRLAGALRGVSGLAVLGAGGLAYLCGMTVTILLCIIALIVGLPFGLPTMLVVALLVSAPLVTAVPAILAQRHRLGRPRLPPLRSSAAALRSERGLAFLVLAGFVVVVVIGLFTVGDRPLSQYDAWNSWGRKANLLFFGDRFPVELFQAQAYAAQPADYPILLPALEALHLRGLGRWDPANMHLVFWLLMGTFVWAGAFLARGVARPAVWSTVLAGVALVTAGPLLTAYADVPVSYFLALGILALGLWLHRGERCDLVVAAILLAGAAAMKNEGIAGAAVAFGVVLTLLAITRRWRALIPAGIAAAAVLLLAVLPWRLFVAANDLGGPIDAAQGLDLSYLADRFDRVLPSVEALHDQLASAPVSILVPLGIAACLVRLRTPRLSTVAVFYLATGFLYAASLVWSYWISPLELGFQLGTSVARIYVGVPFIALAALLHLTTSRTGESDGAASTNALAETVAPAYAAQPPGRERLG